MGKGLHLGARGLKVNAFSATYNHLPTSQRECLGLERCKEMAKSFFPWYLDILYSVKVCLYSEVCLQGIFWEEKVRNHRRGKGKAYTLFVGLEEDVPHTFWQWREGMSRTSAILCQTKSGG